mmetsp:Transcript_2939/g.4435  ORF Transcript_2939/g.4435 Transcript_2939/m.4435 type:complete len:525 (-) Transcript_2939:160-1734(-)
MVASNVKTDKGLFINVEKTNSERTTDISVSVSDSNSFDLSRHKELSIEVDSFPTIVTPGKYHLIFKGTRTYDEKGEITHSSFDDFAENIYAWDMSRPEMIIETAFKSVGSISTAFSEGSLSIIQEQSPELEELDSFTTATKKNNSHESALPPRSSICATIARENLVGANLDSESDILMMQGKKSSEMPCNGKTKSLGQKIFAHENTFVGVESCERRKLTTEQNEPNYEIERSKNTATNSSATTVKDHRKKSSFNTVLQASQFDKLYAESEEGEVQCEAGPKRVERMTGCFPSLSWRSIFSIFKRRSSNRSVGPQKNDKKIGSKASTLRCAEIVEIEEEVVEENKGGLIPCERGISERMEFVNLEGGEVEDVQEKAEHQMTAEKVGQESPLKKAECVESEGNELPSKATEEFPMKKHFEEGYASEEMPSNDKSDVGESRSDRSFSRMSEEEVVEIKPITFKSYIGELARKEEGDNYSFQNMLQKRSFQSEGECGRTHSFSNQDTREALRMCHLKKINTSYGRKFL